MASTLFSSAPRVALCLIPKSVVICVAGLLLLSAPTAMMADAQSSNTLSLQLSFTPAQNNLFGYSYWGAFAVNNVNVPPGGNNGGLNSSPTVASLTLTAPQDVISVSPNNSASKVTSATLSMNLGNLSGGGGPLPAQPYNPMLMASFTYDLNDSAVDNPPFDVADSAYFVTITIAGVQAYFGTLVVNSPQRMMGNVNIPLPNITLPPNSVTSLAVYLGLSANVASTMPPVPPPPPPPPPVEPQYPTPEPSSLMLAFSGGGLVWWIRRAFLRF